MTDKKGREGEKEIIEIEEEVRPTQKQILPAPFINTEGPGGQLPELVQEPSAGMLEHPHRFEIGAADKEPLGGIKNDFEEGGMLVGPGHPGFFPREPCERHYPYPSNILPPGAVPPGARFDPITPLAPGSTDPHHPHYWASGEPDPDELMPPGPFIPGEGGIAGQLGRGVAPKPGQPPKSGNGKFGEFGGNRPFDPSGSGGAPFF